MARSTRSLLGPDRLPVPRPTALLPVRGRSAAANYLRAHLYGAAVGRTILDRCISAVEAADRERLIPLRAEFDLEIATARRLLAGISPWGAPGRRMVRVSATVVLAGLPVGPIVREPLTRLGLLETLRTLVVAKRSMWELLAESWIADDDDDDKNDHHPAHPGHTRTHLLELADQARTQEELLEELRRKYGLAVFG